MKKICFTLVVVISIISIPLLAYGNDMYFYVCKARDGCEYYVDKYSITYAKNDTVVRFWMKSIRKELDWDTLTLSSETEILQRNCYLEMDLLRNAYFIIEEYDSDSKDNVIKTYKVHGQSVWTDIVYDSAMEAIRRSVWDNRKYSRHIIDFPLYENMHKLGATEIIILSLSIGIGMSLIAIIAYYKLFIAPTSANNATKTSKTSIGVDYIDVEFTEKVSDDEFDYPYEDMYDVLKERKYRVE